MISVVDTTLRNSSWHIITKSRSGVELLGCGMDESILNVNIFISALVMLFHWKLNRTLCAGHWCSRYFALYVLHTVANLWIFVRDHLCGRWKCVYRRTCPSDVLFMRVFSETARPLNSYLLASALARRIYCYLYRRIGKFLVVFAFLFYFNSYLFESTQKYSQLQRVGDTAFFLSPSEVVISPWKIVKLRRLRLRGTSIEIIILSTPTWQCHVPDGAFLFIF